MRALFKQAADRGYPPLADFHPDTTGIATFERGVIAARYADLLHSIADNSTRNATPPLITPIELAKA
jgi:hypothetical protein